jgi:bifunctional UDP-N-acetylglucosamine pyrophosphorylase/glucosamine-1-phosphate N-acetyltransferase
MGRAKVKAVILAAGEGSRMRPLTNNRPKAMLPIANKPILEHLIIEAIAAGIGKYIFVVGYHDEQVRRYFGRGKNWGIEIEYVTQRKRMGTADAIKIAKPLIDGKFLVINGDVIVSREDIARMIANNGNTIGIKEVDDVSGFGVVELADNQLRHIYEKSEEPTSNIANTGMYLFNKDIFDFIERIPKSIRGEHEITSSMQLMLEQGQSITCQRIDYWLECSYPWDLLAANEVFMGNEIKNEGNIEEYVVIQGAVSIGADTIIRSGSYIAGPVVIGSNCNIGPNCYIRPFTSIGNGCRIGAAVEIKGSIIMKNTKIPHHNYIGDSVIGEGCNFGSGTKIANLRLDKKNVLVSNLDTKRYKLGAIIGDGVETGINASINVGSVIGNNTIIGPGAVASGIIMPNSRIF